MKAHSLNRSLILIFVAILYAQGASTQDWKVEQLLRKLGSSNESDRVVARQFLPREGARVVPEILPLLGHPDASIWRTADRVLADIANEVSVPGRESERRFVSTQLMTLLVPEASTELKVRALRLLAIVVPEGFDVSPIAALLEDEDLRMKARGALQAIGTRQAMNALMSALLKADKPFQIAILDSLDKIRNVNSLTALRAFSVKPDPEIRVAAARGLARWGNLSDSDILLKVWQDRTPETELDAGNALLLHADEIATQGGNIELAVDRYHQVFQEAENPVLVGAGMMGMAKYGDSRVVPTLFSILKREDSSELIPQFLNAVAALRGTGPNQAVVDRFDDLPEPLRVPVLGILGRKGHPTALPLLARMADSENAESRSAAYEGLADTSLPQAVGILVDHVRNEEGESRSQALNALKSLARSLSEHGQGNEAGQAYQVLLEFASDTDSRKTALEALGRFPRVESFDLLIPFLDRPGFENEAFETVAALTRVLAHSKQKERALQGFDLLTSHVRSPDNIRILAGLAKDLGKSEQFLKDFGFLTHWKLIGPFPWEPTEGFKTEYIGEPHPDPSKNVVYLENEYAWKDYQTTDPSGQVNLETVFGSHEGVVVYAWTTLSMPRDQEATLRVGSDDWIKVWVNGEAVHENPSFRGVSLDQDPIPVVLKEGENTILLRINQGVYGYGFVARLTDREGNPLGID